MKRALNAMLGALDLRIVRASKLARLMGEYDRLRLQNWRLNPVFNIYGNIVEGSPDDAGMQLGGLDGKEPDGGEAGFIARNVKPGHIAIDIGANVGTLALLMARLVGPQGKVIAFEPSPRSYALLAKNTKANGYENVTAENMAIGDRTGETELFISRCGESDSRIAGTVMNAEDRIRRTVACTTLDDYLASHHIPRLDFIKMDIQGAEMMALRGMTKTLRRNHRIEVIIEYVPGAIAGATPSEFLDFLISSGFDLFNLPEEGREHPVTSAWLLDNIGQPNKPPLTNLVLRRPSI